MTQHSERKEKAKKSTKQRNKISEDCTRLTGTLYIHTRICLLGLLNVGCILISELAQFAQLSLFKVQIEGIMREVRDYLLKELNGYRVSS